MKTPIVIDLTDEPQEPVEHTCTVCGKTEMWRPGWTWYGSWRELDVSSAPVVKCCSRQCRLTHAVRNAYDPTPLVTS